MLLKALLHHKIEVTARNAATGGLAKEFEDYALHVGPRKGLIESPKETESVLLFRMVTAGTSGR